MSAFSGCTALETINIPSTVTSIGNTAFAYTALKSIKIPKSVTLSTNAIAECYSLESVEIDTLSIPNNAVASCPLLKTVVIGENVSSIESYGLNIVTLESVTFKNPKGWKINGKSVSEDDLKDKEKAAQLLKTNRDKTWTHSDS